MTKLYCCYFLKHSLLRHKDKRCVELHQLFHPYQRTMTQCTLNSTSMPDITQVASYNSMPDFLLRDEKFRIQKKCLLISTSDLLKYSFLLCKRVFVFFFSLGCQFTLVPACHLASPTGRTALRSDSPAPRPQPSGSSLSCEPF